MAKIVILLDGKILKERNLDKEIITLGRDAGNDIQIDNLALSNQHLKIVNSDTGSLLVNLDSTIGAVVNGENISQHLLQDLDAVQVGKFTIQYFRDLKIEDALLSKKEANNHDAAIQAPIANYKFGSTIFLRYRDSKVTLLVILFCLVATMYATYWLVLQRGNLHTSFGQIGRFAVNPQFDSTRGFKEGLAAVRIGDDKTGKWGFIDKQGKMVILPQFDLTWAFNEELAAVRIGDELTGKWGFIDKQGKMVIQPQFNITSFFHDGLAPALVIAYLANGD
ncbi:MAG: WG repeat-containing protein [Dechloromonas sp.]|uniref:WG repeat-containing protein n=1 Tax=Candidatus Dechloromonas phosphorivorans TaxID=2899244 RepID=A0A935KAX2_9RHOO|nr:WG repeat-containing protein [Candidatus Dechloromonas phosphorivorans]